MTVSRQVSLITHLNTPTQLLTYATRSSTRTDLVVTPEQFHRRNLKRELASRNHPRSSMRFVRPTEIAHTLVDEAGLNTELLDRVDRIREIETLVETNPTLFEAFEPLLGPGLAAQATEIEATRRAIGAVTAYDADRLRTLRTLLDDWSLERSTYLDARDRLDGAIATEEILAETVDVAVSEDAIMRMAVDLLRDTERNVWGSVYPNVERVHLAGVSSLGAPLLDLFSAIDAETPADAHIYLRAGTGPRLDARLRGQPRSSSNRQPVDLDIPVTELVTATRAQEARVVLAVVDALLTAGVSPSDVLIVARTIDTYEHELTRAARQYGQTLSLWTQLSVTETGPYALVETLCELFDNADSPVPLEQLIRPLASEWVHPETGAWASTSKALDSVQTELRPDEPLPLETWRARAGDLDTTHEDAPVGSFLDWVGKQPASPSPADVSETFAPLFEAYREVVLPARHDRDGAALSETTETARALIRMEELVDEVAIKYETWLRRDHTEPSWEIVQYLFETIATVRPGRREHANARVVDVVDATDTWLREVPYVVALGFVDGLWPQVPDGLLPVTVRDRILAGETEAVRTLAARERWTEDREYDHFADAVSTATEQLVCTRHQRDSDGARLHRSTFLELLDTNLVSRAATNRLLGTDRVVPPVLVDALPNAVRDSRQTAQESGATGSADGESTQVENQ